MVEPESDDKVNCSDAKRSDGNDHDKVTFSNIFEIKRHDEHRESDSQLDKFNLN